MLRGLLQRLYVRLGARYPRVVLAFAFVLAFFVVGGGVLLLNLYVDISLETFWRILAVSAILVSIEVAGALWLGYRLARPADRWLRGERTPESALAAWCALAGLPLDLLRFGRGIPVALNTVPISIYVTLELDGTFLSFLAITAARSSCSPTASSCASSSPSWPCARCWPTSPATCPTARTSASARCPSATSC
jgi:hypothetical protein